MRRPPHPFGTNSLGFCDPSPKKDFSISLTRNSRARDFQVRTVTATGAVAEEYDGGFLSKEKSAARIMAGAAGRGIEGEP
jgi:hypothetical protein